MRDPFAGARTCLPRPCDAGRRQHRARDAGAGSAVVQRASRAGVQHAPRARRDGQAGRSARFARRCRQPGGADGKRAAARAGHLPRGLARRLDRYARDGRRFHVRRRAAMTMPAGHGGSAQ